MAELQQFASTGRTDDAMLTFATQSKSSPSASPHDLVLNVYDHAMLTLIAATCTHFFSVDVSPTTTLMLARHVTVLVEGMRKEMEALHEPVQWWRVLPININPHKRAMLHAQQCLQQWYVHMERESPWGIVRHVRVPSIPRVARDVVLVCVVVV